MGKMQKKNLVNVKLLSGSGGIVYQRKQIDGQNIIAITIILIGGMLYLSGTIILASVASS